MIVTDRLTSCSGAIPADLQLRDRCCANDEKTWLLIACPALLLTDCGSSPDHKWLESYVKENIKEINGALLDVTPVGETALSNKRLGCAELTINGRK